VLTNPLAKTAAALAAVCATALLLCSCGADSGVAPPPPSVGQTANAPVPKQILQTGLVDSSGRQLTIASLRGKVVVVSDAMTLCQGTCPLDTANVVGAARRVEAAGLGQRVVFLTVTIDPARDTPARLAAYRRLYAPAPADWLALTGSAAGLNTFWDGLGVYREKAAEERPAPEDWWTGKPLSYDITHSDQVFFLDGNSHRRFVLDGAPHVAPGTPVPRTLLNFLSAEGRRDLAHPDAQAWTQAQVVQVLSWLLDAKL
jgi:protein SCO1/2